MTYRKKLIEVALPLEAINAASAREKSIRHGHPSTLHLWWARRPLAACRAVIFASLVDDPNDPDAPPAYVEACRTLPRGKNAAENDTPRQRLFDFIERLVLWESTTDEQVLETARELIRLATDGNPPPLLDPFAGGGSIPLEAQRLGLEAHASDLNPVAVMINKALIEIPPKFANRPPVNPRDNPQIHNEVRSNDFSRLKETAKAVTTNLPLEKEWKGAAGLAADVRYYGEWMREMAWERIGHLYPKYGTRASGPHADGTSAVQEETVIAWLWARTVTCPNPACGAQMPLVRSFDLSKKKGRRAWVIPHVDPETRKITFEVKQNQPKGKGPKGTVNRRGATCLACGTPVSLDYIRGEGKAGQIGAQLMAIVTDGNPGRNYYLPNAEHKQKAQVTIPSDVPETDLPKRALGFRVQLYGMTKHRSLFSPRQLVSLVTFSDLINEVQRQVKADALAAELNNDDTPLREGGTGVYAYAEAVSVYLSMSLSRVAMGCNSLARWNSVGQKVQHCFGRQTLSMIWDYADPNPFTESTGSWASGYKYVADPLEMGGVFPDVPGLVEQRNATTKYNNSGIIISTDPPYYDNVGYADLSDFFYIWLRPTLQNIYPSIFGTMLVPKMPELIATPYRFGGDKQAAKEHFEEGLFQTFLTLRGVVSKDYPFSVYYAFKQADIRYRDKSSSSSVSNTGWETMLHGLIRAGFLIDGTWPIRTEMKTRLRSFGSNALASSIVLVCRPRPDDAPLTSRRDFVNALRQELPQALREMQSGNIAPVDLAQASIGPGMAVYSRYSRVLEPNGDPLTVRTALQLINQVLDAYLAEQEGHLDPASRFAVAWFEQYGFNAGDFGTADVLARAKNTSVDTLARAGFIESGAGKVRLLPWDELDPGRLGTRASGPPADGTSAVQVTVWEATHYLIERLNTHGEQGVAMLLARMPSELAADARQLAYRLYSLCERKGWAEHARDYNALVVSWGASQEQARGLKAQYQQGKLF